MKFVACKLALSGGKRHVKTPKEHHSFHSLAKIACIVTADRILPPGDPSVTGLPFPPPPFPVPPRPAALLLPERRRPRAGRALPAGGAGQQDPLPPPGAGPRHPGHHPPPGRLQHAGGQLRQAHLRQRRWVELYAGARGRPGGTKRRLAVEDSVTTSKTLYSTPIGVE